MFTDELNLALVVSSESYAEILSIDISDALAMPGVVTFVDHKDVPGKNNYGVCAKDDEIFATNVVSEKF
jgi:xanthine dehydrogenase molybdopterin-binding subunit B